MTTTHIDLVPERDACPACGERDIDRLVWIDDERIECQRCKRVYSLGDDDER